jgi:hypothetical protein
MATTQTAPRAGECKPEYGAPEIIAMKFLEPKMFTGAYGPRALFTLTDERKLWLDGDDASDIVRDMQEKGIQRNQPFRLTKIRHPRGGGHCFRVEALAQSAPAWVTATGTAPAHREPAAPSAIEDQLAQSLTLARTHGAQAFQRGAHIAQPRPAEVPALDTVPPATAPETSNRTASQQLMGSFAAAIETLAESQKYAARHGMPIVFSSEDVRACALTIYINACKEARW